MKRILAILAVVVAMVGLVGSAIADEKKFDVSDYEKLDGYKYDKFERKWICTEVYKKQYSDAVLVFGIQIEGNKDGLAYAPIIFGWVRDKNNIKQLYEVKAVSILIDDTVFELRKVIKSGDDWAAYLDSNVGKEFIRRLASAKEISIKYRSNNTSITEDLEKTKIGNLLEIAKAMVKNDPWAFIKDENGRVAKYYDRIVKSNCMMTMK